MGVEMQYKSCLENNNTRIRRSGSWQTSFCVASPRSRRTTQGSCSPSVSPRHSVDTDRSSVDAFSLEDDFTARDEASARHTVEIDQNDEQNDDDIELGVNSVPWETTTPRSIPSLPVEFSAGFRRSRRGAVKPYVARHV